jgi:pleiotropic regulator 1|tara:strand:+ start:82 stop:1698 length:1617 start_codon:yes stop_codon:yes gene_type:complete
MTKVKSPDPVALAELSAKRTKALFSVEEEERVSLPSPMHRPSIERKMSVKIRDEYEAVRHMAPPEIKPRDASNNNKNRARLAATTNDTNNNNNNNNSNKRFEKTIPGLAEAANLAAKNKRKLTDDDGSEKTDLASLIDSIDEPVRERIEANASGGILAKLKSQEMGEKSGALVQYSADTNATSKSSVFGVNANMKSSALVTANLASKWPRPDWKKPWKLYRVISGHQGWVRSVAVDKSNEWFATGSGDRCIKIWDLATGGLKLTLTGHIEQVMGLAISDKHPYMFSCGADKKVKCWDLEYNKVIRNYHGHLSGVYSIALHPDLDILMTGGRDSACRVWDIRTKTQVFCLSGHESTIGSIITENVDPQVITGSYDSTIKTWDLAAGKCMKTLTHHKKGVRAMVMHQKYWEFSSASADNIKKFGLPDGKFKHNMLSKQNAIVNAMALNEDNVMISGGDNGSMHFWDYETGHCFQSLQTQVQPGSMEAEAGIFALSFDKTGERLISCEADKTIKMWKPDPDASPESHPNLPFVPPKNIGRS